MDTEGKRTKGRPSLETLQGVRHAMARAVRAMRDGKRDIELGESLVRSMARLAQVIVMEREQGLHTIPDQELEVEIERRIAARTAASPPSAGLQ